MRISSIIIAFSLAILCSTAKAESKSLETLAVNKYGNEVVDFVLKNSPEQDQALECLTGKYSNIWDINTIIVGVSGVALIYFDYPHTSSTEIITDITKNIIEEELRDIKTENLHKV